MGPWVVLASKSGASAPIGRGPLAVTTLIALLLELKVNADDIRAIQVASGPAIDVASACRSTLPRWVRGNVSRKMTSRGYLYGSSRAFAKACSCCASVLDGVSAT